MRRRLQRGQDNAEVNVTPMLDIVFILLIFFIVTATFLDERGVEIFKPPSDAPPDPDPPPAILVSIDSNDFIYVNARVTDVERVGASIQRQMVDNGGESAVQIRPHVDATHGVVTRVYDQASRTGAVGVVVRDPEDF